MSDIKKNNGENTSSDVLLEVKNLRKCFPIQKNLLGKVEKELVAVDDVSLPSRRARHLVSLASRDAERPPWEEPS